MVDVMARVEFSEARSQETLPSFPHAYRGPSTWPILQAHQLGARSEVEQPEPELNQKGKIKVSKIQGSCVLALF